MRIVPVESGRDVTHFITAARAAYAADAAWVQPLVVERRLHLSKRNPVFAHTRARFWTANRDGRPVGRISAQVDDLHLQTHRDATGFFGFLEAADDGEVFAALFRAAEAWLREEGMRRALGPFSFSINDECGLLIDGFDTPPMFMMGHARPYYDARVKEQGYVKAKDTVAYLLDPALTPPEVMAASVRKAAASGVRVRPIRMSRLAEEMGILREIFNDAWSTNWNAVPFTAAEMEELGKSLRLFVPSEYVQIAEVNGEPAGMIVVVPNLNEYFRDFGGRLLPTNWLRLLWRLRRSPRSARVPLMGVRKRYQRSALGMALVFVLVEAVRRPLLERNVHQVELSWTLEDNRPMHHIKERLGARPYKRYRIYEKPLA